MTLKAPENTPPDHPRGPTAQGTVFQPDCRHPAHLYILSSPVMPASVLHLHPITTQKVHREREVMLCPLNTEATSHRHL